MAKQSVLHIPNTARAMARFLLTGGLAVGALCLVSACSQQQGETSNTTQRPAPTTAAADYIAQQARLFDCGAAASPCPNRGAGGFPLIDGGAPAPVVVAVNEMAGIRRAAENLRTDLSEIGGSRGVLVNEMQNAAEGPVIIVGTIGQGGHIDNLIEAGVLDVSDIEGEWEAFHIEVIDDLMDGVPSALIIAGSDKRGTIFGMYDILDKAGMSPWHYWADVPVDNHDNLFVTRGVRQDMPTVKYRGIFLNDEEPALGNWVRETYGDFNADFYEQVFDLTLRLKGNYIWPAMWGKAIYDDDPATAGLADEMGIVLGTTHHEPLGRAHVEWDRYGEGDWNYRTNAEYLREFWREGMERMGDGETIVTVGMRGDGDEAMSEGTETELLEQVVADQRQIIEEVTGAPASETPQLWALYKEVQDYYDQGMEVPDDVTLLFADDNWGNIRRLPQLGAERPGGYGVYYHFDYVGGPRNYKWINTTQIERVWEQMHLANEYGATEIWIVNVGDLKPMEFPIDFFLDYAWAPEDWPLERLPSYTTQWAAEQFGTEHAREIAAMLALYTKYNARRKPELLDADSYSVTAYDEFERVTADYMALAQSADDLLEEIDPRYEDAYRQLVWFPIRASANLYRLYYAVAQNRLYAEQGRASANDYARLAEEYYAADAELTDIYHTQIADGKWNHVMSQTHIGYTYWQQPEEQTMPEVTRVSPESGAAIGVAVEGSRDAWPGAGEAASLPTLEPWSEGHWLEVFNRGLEEVRYEVTPREDWLILSRQSGMISGDAEQDVRVAVTADWSQVPAGRSEGEVMVTGSDGTEVAVTVPVFKPEDSVPEEAHPIRDGHVALAATAADAVANGDAQWRVIPNLGKTGSAVALFPVTAEPYEPGGDSPHLAYDVFTFEGGTADVTVTVSPTLDFAGGEGLRFAVSVDDGAPQMVNINETGDGQNWDRWVADNEISRTVSVSLSEPGAHQIKVWAVDPGVVFQKLVVATEDLPETYLGPPVAAR